MILKTALIPLLCITALTGCALLSSGTEDHDQDLEQLVAWMTGSFSSEAQSKSDPEFYDIRLQMARVWEHRTDGFWLYVEQAVATHLDKPYRQRVYHVTRVDADTFESAVLELEEPLRYAGVWKKEKPLSALTPASLIPREGASIFLAKTAKNSYEGSTRGKECKSDYRGASYATSRVRISENEIYSWDQGFNENDEQVWGAVKGGYVFVRVQSD